jgi:hypothetical protein
LFIIGLVLMAVGIGVAVSGVGADQSDAIAGGIFLVVIGAGVLTRGLIAGLTRKKS